VQLAGDAQAEDHDELAGEDVHLPLRVETGRQHLDHRSRTRIDRLRERKDMTGWCGHEFCESTVGVASDEHAVAAQVCLTDPAMKAGAAVELRVDDDAVAGPQRAGAGVHNFPRHLVPHDPGVADRDGAVEDLVVGAADAAVRHPHQHLLELATRPRDLVPDQLAGRGENHGFHRSTKSKV
jgi:hypothetical protein